VQEARELAPLLEASIDSLSQNPETDEDIKRAISKPTVFDFKDEGDNLVAYFTMRNI